MTSRDDLYATPIRRSERGVKPATAMSSQTPIVQRNRSSGGGGGGGGFLTSTPTHEHEQNASSISLNTTNRSGSLRNLHEAASTTCADRIGHSKTTLMDFKKLLLAKSAKTSATPRKLSAVELLKKSSAEQQQAQSPTSPLQPLNASLKLLDLSGSPKTFANRRMLRQGQFGSPSKAFSPRLKANGGGSSSTLQRTDIISTPIQEVSAEEDSSSSSRAGSEPSSDAQSRRSIASTNFELKRNFFAQHEPKAAPQTNGNANANTSAPAALETAL